MPVCSQKMGPPKYKNLPLYLNEGENNKSKASSIVKWWPLLSKKCKCSQLAKKVADIPELVQFVYQSPHGIKWDGHNLFVGD